MTGSINIIIHTFITQYTKRAPDIIILDAMTDISMYNRHDLDKSKLRPK